MLKQSSIELRSFRIITVIISVSLLFLLIIFRLVQIQIIEAPIYKEKAQRQYEKDVPLPPSRGLIYDKNNTLLVSNSTLVSFAADPLVVKNNLTPTTKTFSQTFGKPVSNYKTKLSTKKRFVWLEKNSHPKVAEKITQKKLPGIISVNESKRLFYNGAVAVQTIGLTNFQNRGNSGLEYHYNSILKGDSGFVVMQRDGLGKISASVEYPRQEPINGNSIYLTLDLEYQSIIEDELKKGIERTKADAGCVVMVNPNTGEVLGIANYPTFDPGTNRNFEQEALKNRAVTELYEPGSLFKVVTVSAGLSNNSISLDQKFFAENGKYVVKINSGKTRTIEDTHPLYGEVTVSDALKYSSNIVMAKISNIIGAEQLYTHARSFGFGFPTNIELPHEATGELKKPHTWSVTTLNTMSYGYEINATPLQLAMAFSVIANGGMLLKPYVVRKIETETGEVVEENGTKLIRRVITKDVAEKLKETLTKVVEDGTGSETKLNDLPIAGKTGTARKYVDGKYKKGFYNALFAGFYPSDKPEIVCVVLLENPKGGYYGGTTSAIIFRGIAERLHRNKGIFTKNGNYKIASVEIPNNQKTSDTKNNIEKVQIVKIENGNKIVIPNVCGYTLRKALSVLKSVNLQAKINGTGVVVSQMPQAGSSIPKRSTIILNCSNSLAVNNSPNEKKLTLKN